MQPLQPCKFQMKYNEILRWLMQSQFRVKSTACRLWKGLKWPEGLCTQTCQDDDDEIGKVGGLFLLIGWNQLSYHSISFHINIL